jgi:hypothetical protein
VYLERCGRDDAPPAASFADHTGFQLDDWIDFLRESQRGEPVYARVVADGETVGRFAGLVVRKFGVRILGSPFPGWSTAYMGFNLRDGVHRAQAARALEPFAFGELGCLHFEFMDRRLDGASAAALPFRHRPVAGWEVDLTRPEREILARMTPACRRNLRRAAKEGVEVEIADDPGFADDYYTQLEEVFARQGLAPTYPRRRVAALLRNVLPGGGLLLLRARDRAGRCIATGIFAGANDLMYFWGGASLTEERIVRPNEAIQWFAMRYWRSRGVERYDMGGGGRYKSKYGGREIVVPWVRQSRFGALEGLRTGARFAWSLGQRRTVLVPPGAERRGGSRVRRHLTG